MESNDFKAIWKLASLYCQPSLYEGFGIPVLEAMEARLPVLASKTQSLVEIAQGSAIFANPKSAKDFAEKICFVLDKPLVRKELVKRGEKHVRKFSWDKTARKTYEIYKKVHSE